MPTTELIYRCKKCGNEVRVQVKDREKAEKWLDTMFGICPAGGNHVELGNKRDYLEFVGDSDKLSPVPTKREILEKLLQKVREKKAILVVGLNNPDIPTIQNFCNKEIHRTVRHCGFGFFEGSTEQGTFSFDAGGAMIHHQFPSGTHLSWTPLRATAEVLEVLGYDFQKVENALEGEIQSLP